MIPVANESLTIPSLWFVNHMHTVDKSRLSTVKLCLAYFYEFRVPYLYGER